MMKISAPAFATNLAAVRASAAAALAVKAGCAPEDLRVTAQTNVSFAQRLEDPTGQHAIEIVVLVGAMAAVYHGADCGCGDHAGAPVANPRPMGTTAPDASQADGGHG